MWKLTNKLFHLAAIMFLFLMFGCAVPGSNIEKSGKISQETTTGDNVLLMFVIADVASSTDVQQEAKSDSQGVAEAVIAAAGLVVDVATPADMDTVERAIDAVIPDEVVPVDDKKKR